MMSMTQCPFQNMSKDFKWANSVFSKTENMSLKFGKLVTQETFPNYEPQCWWGII